MRAFVSILHRLHAGTVAPEHLALGSGSQGRRLCASRDREYIWLVRPVAARGCFVIADISGYTDHVVASPLAHAEDVLADVTATVVDRLERVIHVNKLEGDAVLTRSA